MHKGAERVGAQPGRAGREWGMQVQLLTDRQSGFQLGWHERRVEEQRAHGKVAAAAEVGEAGHNGRWVVGGSLSHVIPHRHAHTHTQRERRGRRTLFPVNVLENMNIISRKRKLQHLQGSGRQAGDEGGEELGLAGHLRLRLPAGTAAGRRAAAAASSAD